MMELQELQDQGDSNTTNNNNNNNNSSSSSSSSNSNDEHPLNREWTLWHMRRLPKNDARKTEYNEYEKSIKTIGSFNTVESFWKLYSHVVRPNDAPHVFDFHVFRKNVKPIWEDVANRKGGKFTVRIPKGLGSQMWERVLLSIIGEQLLSAGVSDNSTVKNEYFSTSLDNEICGAVISIRPNEDVISVWCHNAENREAVHRIRQGMKKVMDLPPFVTVQFKRHDTALQDKAQTRPSTGWRSRKPTIGDTSTRPGHFGLRNDHYSSTQSGYGASPSVNMNNGGGPGGPGGHPMGMGTTRGMDSRHITPKRVPPFSNTNYPRSSAYPSSAPRSARKPNMPSAFPPRQDYSSQTTPSMKSGMPTTSQVNPKDLSTNTQPSTTPRRDLGGPLRFDTSSRQRSFQKDNAPLGWNESL